MLDWAASTTATDSNVLKMALKNIAEQDGQPALAAEYLDKLTNASQRDQITGTIALSMAKEDPATALEWLDQAAAGAAYDSNVKKIFSDLSQHSPAQLRRCLIR